MNNLISIVVPVFNAKDKIEKCVQSLINQSYENIEIILVDDGSVDGSSELCDSFTKNPKLKVIHKKNEGVSSARNEGMKVAKGKYICFVDADDIVDKRYIENMYFNMNDKVDLVVCNYYINDLIKNIKSKSILSSGEYEVKDIISDYWQYFNKGLINAPWNKMFKMSIIKKNNIEFPYGVTIGEDGYFVNYYLCFSKKIKVIDDILYSYYIYSLQSSKKTIDNYFEIMNKNMDMIDKLITLKSERVNLNLMNYHKIEYFKIIKESIRSIIVNKKYSYRVKRLKIKEVYSNNRTKECLVYLNPKNMQEKILKKLLLKEKKTSILILYSFYYKEMMLWRR